MRGSLIRAAIEAADASRLVEAPTPSSMSCARFSDRAVEETRALLVTTAKPR